MCHVCGDCELPRLGAEDESVGVKGGSIRSLEFVFCNLAIRRRSQLQLQSTLNEFLIVRRGPLNFARLYFRQS